MRRANMKTVYYDNINDSRYDIVEAQSNDKSCVIIDMLHELEPRFMELSGVLFDNLLIAQPESEEQAAEIAGALAKGGCDFLATTQAWRLK
jgi:RecA/RadA recombinase